MKKLITFIVTLSAAVIPQSLDSIPFEYWKVSDFGMAFEVEAKDKFNSQGSISQDWMPLALGNKWQYIKTTAEYPFNNPTNNISTDSVNEKIIINGLEYFKINSSIYRYNKDLQILYYRANDDSDYVIIDFTKPPGYQYSRPPFYNCTIKQGNATLFDSVQFYKGYSYWWIYGHGEERYSRNIGKFYSYGWSDVSGHPPYESTSVLIETILFDSTEIRYYAYNNYPEIMITPILKISNPNFELNFSVMHMYTKNNFSFIDSVIMYSHYSKEDSIINIAPVLAINQPINSKNYTVTTILNMGLLADGFNYNYRFTSKDKHLIPKYDFSPDSGYFVAIFDSLTDVREESFIKSFKLDQNYPNPFNPFTTIRYAIAERQNVTMKVYDILGKEVVTLLNEEKHAGYYQIDFDPAKYNLASGVYFCELRLNNVPSNKIKMIYLK